MHDLHCMRKKKKKKTYITYKAWKKNVFTILCITLLTRRNRYLLLHARYVTLGLKKTPTKQQNRRNKTL